MKMNIKEKEYAIRRLRAIADRKRWKLDELNPDKNNLGDLWDEAQRKVNKMALRCNVNIRAYSGSGRLDDASNARVMDVIKKTKAAISAIREDPKTSLIAKIDAEFQRFSDAIMLGDSAEALAAIEAFEKMEF